MKSILLVKQFLGVVEMMFRLVNASFSLPEWQAVKMIFFAPCTREITIQWIIIRETNCANHWIEIYLVDSAIHLLNNWDLILSDYHKNAGFYHT